MGKFTRIVTSTVLASTVLISGISNSYAAVDPVTTGYVKSEDFEINHHENGDRRLASSTSATEDQLLYVDGGKWRDSNNAVQDTLSPKNLEDGKHDWVASFTNANGNVMGNIIFGKNLYNNIGEKYIISLDMNFCDIWGMRLRINDVAKKTTIADAFAVNRNKQVFAFTDKHGSFNGSGEYTITPATEPLTLDKW